MMELRNKMLKPLKVKFKFNHPECKPREVFIANTLATNDSYSHFKHFRFGRVAYDDNGRDISHQGFRPVFVLKLELLRKKMFDD